VGWRPGTSFHSCRLPGISDSLLILSESLVIDSLLLIAMLFTRTLPASAKCVLRIILQRFRHTNYHAIRFEQELERCLVMAHADRESDQLLWILVAPAKRFSTCAVAAVQEESFRVLVLV
jgi:hypothetical protein